MTGHIGAIETTRFKRFTKDCYAALDKQLETGRGLSAQIERKTQIQSLCYERARVKEKIRNIRAVMRQVKPRHKNYRAARWCSLDGQDWDQVEKMSWDRLESFERNNEEERKWMWTVLEDGAVELTPRQRQVLKLLYRETKPPRGVAETLGVDVSTVYRTAKRGIAKLRKYAEGRGLVRTCTREDGSMDEIRLITESTVLTQRQKQVLRLLCDGLNQTQVAQKLGVGTSTVGRTMRRGKQRLEKLTHELNVPMLPQTRKENICQSGLDWHISCKELAAMYGVHLGMIYKLTVGTRRWEGMTALQYQVWMRKKAGECPRSIATALGMNVKNVYQVLSRAEKQNKPAEGEQKHRGKGLNTQKDRPGRGGPCCLGEKQGALRKAKGSAST